MTETPLHKAAANNHVEIVKFLLEWQGEEKADVEAKNMVILSFSFCPSRSNAEFVNQSTHYDCSDFGVVEYLK